MTSDQVLLLVVSIAVLALSVLAVKLLDHIKRIETYLKPLQGTDNETDC